MQTFLPYPDYRQSALALDRARLGKQRVEVIQILRSLAGLTDGWRNHPAVRMWRGAEQHLAAYGLAICGEWRRRGYRDTCMEKIAALAREFPLDQDAPAWLGDERFHAAHRAALLAKDPAHYGSCGWTEQPMIAYWWPVQEGAA